jgi:MFS family permease
MGHRSLILSILVGAQLVDAVGLGLLLPVLPLYVGTLGASPAGVTLLVAIYALMGIIFAPMAGRLSDRIGRKPVIILGSALVVGSYAGMAAGSSLESIFVFRAVGGIGAAKAGVVSALLMDEVEADQHARWLGLLGSLTGIGMFIGPVLGALLIQMNPFALDEVQTVMASATVMAAVIFLLAFVLPGERGVAKTVADKNPRSVAPVLDLLALQVGVFFAFSGIFSASAIYMEAVFGWGMAEVGYAIGLMTGGVAIARAFLAHRALQRFGNGFGTKGTSALLAGLLMVLPAIQAWQGFLLIYCLAAMAYSISAIAITVEAAGRVPHAIRGSTMGRLTAASSAGIVLGATVNGYLFQTIAPGSPFLVGGAVLVVVLAAFVATENERRGVIGTDP